MGPCQKHAGATKIYIMHEYKPLLFSEIKTTVIFEIKNTVIPACFWQESIFFQVGMFDQCYPTAGT